MTRTTRTRTARGRRTRALMAVLALGMGLTLIPGHAARNTEASQAMTTQMTAGTLSARQQAIPLIAAFMATSDMSGLNTALNQGLDAGLTVSEGSTVDSGTLLCVIA